VTVQAYAKINLSLEVFGTRPDGFHELKSIVQPIALADELVFEPADIFSTDTGYSDDLILKAARALSSRFPNRPAYAIRVTKRIPVGGGLGGGSADAAATLLALNALWKLGLSSEALADIGAEVGSDVPALVLGQHYHRPVLMEGRGERVSLLDLVVDERPLVLTNPKVHCSTADVYRLCTERTSPAVGRVNDLQAPACQLHPEIATALAALVVAGAQDAAMSGSGSTVFGFAASNSAAETIAAQMRAIGCDAVVTSCL